jgi:hypothetical protein
MKKDQTSLYLVTPRDEAGQMSAREERRTELGAVGAVAVACPWLSIKKKTRICSPVVLVYGCICEFILVNCPFHIYIFILWLGECFSGIFISGVFFKADFRCIFQILFQKLIFRELRG